MRTKIQDGNRLDFIAPYDIDINEPVLIGQIFGIAFISAKKGERITVDTVGVHELSKVQNTAVSIGQTAYYHEDLKLITNTYDEKAHPIGYFTADEEEASNKCFVRLTPTCTITIKQAGNPSLESEESGDSSSR